ASNDVASDGATDGATNQAPPAAGGAESSMSSSDQVERRSTDIVPAAGGGAAAAGGQPGIAGYSPMELLGAAVVVVLLLALLVTMLLRRRPADPVVPGVVRPSGMPEAWLRDLGGATGQERHDLDKAFTIIGRVPPDSREDVGAITLPLSSVGRRHAAIEYKDHRLWLVDQQSANGTFINGKRLADQPVQLNHGDRVTIANTEFEFVLGALEGADKTVIMKPGDIAHLNTQRLRAGAGGGDAIGAAAVVSGGQADGAAPDGTKEVPPVSGPPVTGPPVSVPPVDEDPAAHVATVRSAWKGPGRFDADQTSEARRTPKRNTKSSISPHDRLRAQLEAVPSDETWDPTAPDDDDDVERNEQTLPSARAIASSLNEFFDGQEDSRIDAGTSSLASLVRNKNKQNS
ncbi:MAG: FHA domain-containing protein, partial [Gammaproteobacteria bacterium]|nr:FHA domain-containing protein [Gammaproteobacteria bacterium]